MFDMDVLPLLKTGVRIINVGRGSVISEAALTIGLERGIVHSAALDVFEVGLLPLTAQIHHFEDRIIFGSHNASNTEDAVRHVSMKAIKLQAEFFQC